MTIDDKTIGKNLVKSLDKAGLTVNDDKTENSNVSQ